MILYYSARVGLKLMAYNHSSAAETAIGHSASAAGGDANPYLSSLNTPESATEAVMHALQMQDWRTFYFVSAFWRDAARTNTDANVLASEMQMLLNTSANGRDFQAVMRAMHDIKVSGGSEGGDRCDVAVNAATSFMGRPLKLTGTAHLIKLSGHWYLNLTEENGRTTSSAFADLAGLSNLRSDSGSLIFPGAGSFFRPGIESMGHGGGIVGVPPSAQQPPASANGDVQGSVPPGMNFPRGFTPGQGSMPMGRIQPPRGMMQSDPQNGMQEMGSGMPGQAPNFPRGPMGPRFTPGPRFGPFSGSAGGRFSGSSGPGAQGPTGTSEGAQPGPPDAQPPDTGGQPDRRGGF